ncbi:hypothetical protein D3C85_1928560 [compost metagenome]
MSLLFFRYAQIVKQGLDIVHHAVETISNMSELIIAFELDACFELTTCRCLELLCDRRHWFADIVRNPDG